MSRSTPDLIAAIERGRLADVGDDVAALGGARIGDACRSIARAVAAEQQRVVAALAAAGVEATPHLVPHAMQRHEFVVAVVTDDAPRAAIELAGRLGYRRHPSWRGGAERSFWATAHEVALTRSDDATYVARLRWATPRPRRRRSAVFRPTPADWAAVDLPSWAWRGYSIVRPVRLLGERIRATPDHAALEPFLATPSSLIDPLLDLAEVTAADTLVDIGCGDGRIVVGAAERHGCRAVGYEYDESLVTAARARVADARLGHLVEIVRGDGLSADLGGVTVAMLFVPMGVARRIVPALLDRLPSGARIVLHEQTPLPAGMPSPDRSSAIVTADAVTVGRRWDVDD